MRKFLLILSLALLSNFHLNAEIVKRIDISGNKRVSEETVKIYGEIEVNKNYSERDLNEILTNLYSTNFFEKWQ